MLTLCARERTPGCPKKERRKLKHRLQIGCEDHIKTLPEDLQSMKTQGSP